VPSTPVDAHFDLTDPDLLADHLPLDEFAWLRRNQPVRWNPQTSTGSDYGDGGFWALTRHADVSAVTRSPGWSVEAKSAFARRLDASDPTGESSKNLLLCMDPPRHTRVRSVGNRCFTPRALAGLEDDLREQAHRIVWAAKREGTGDFVIDVARHLPLQAIAGLMGIPDADQQQFFHWSDQMAGSEDPEYASDLSGTIEMFVYAHAAAEARVEVDFGDVTSRLVRPDAKGERLTSEEFGFFFMILAVAGNETTRQAITHGMLAFLEHPDQWDRWRSERPSTAVDEILRWASPAVVLQRTAIEDTEVAGRPVRQGERVGLYFASANFDEEVFDDPRQFDIGRSHNPHVTFGAGGSHYCLGANLSRLELKVMFDVLAEELGDVTLMGPPGRLRSSWLNGIKHLPVHYGGSR
jgi:cholest-4-en-3-one 26-monooxygenase